jgi:hypothetical protein
LLVSEDNLVVVVVVVVEVEVGGGSAALVICQSIDGVVVYGDIDTSPTQTTEMTTVQY